MGGKNILNTILFSSRSLSSMMNSSESSYPLFRVSESLYRFFPALMRYIKRTETKIVNTIVAIEDMKKKISAFSNDSKFVVYHRKREVAVARCDVMRDIGTHWKHNKEHIRIISSPLFDFLETSLNLMRQLLEQPEWVV